MADEASKPALSGWAHGLLAIYDTFLLRDLLGYVFPGAVLLLGADRLWFSNVPVLDRICSLSSKDWRAVALGLAAAYSAGVFLRLLGTWTRILVIAPVVGWLGDPWDLNTDNGRRSTMLARLWKARERLWKRPDEEAVVAQYRRLYPPGSDARARATDREGVFLNLAGTLGLALLAVGVISIGARVGLPAARPLSGLVTALLVGGGIVFIAGHYTHARAIHLLNRP